MRDEDLTREQLNDLLDRSTGHLDRVVALLIRSDATRDHPDQEEWLAIRHTTQELYQSVLATTLDLLDKLSAMQPRFPPDFYDAGDETALMHLRLLGNPHYVPPVSASVPATPERKEELVMFEAGPSPVWWTRGLVGIPPK